MMEQRSDQSLFHDDNNYGVPSYSGGMNFEGIIELFNILSVVLF